MASENLSKINSRHFERLREAFGRDNPIFRLHFGSIAHEIHEFEQKSEKDNGQKSESDLLIRSFDPSDLKVNVARKKRTKKDKLGVRKRAKITTSVGKVVLSVQELPTKRRIFRPDNCPKPPREDAKIEAPKSKKKKRTKNCGLIIPQSILSKQQALKKVEVKKSSKLLQMLKDDERGSENDNRSKLQKFLG